MYKRVLTEEDHKEIEQYLKEGKTYQEIGDKYGVSRERIRQLAKRFGLHGYGMTLRRNRQLEQYEAKMKAKYGSFWKGDAIEKSDFLYACKEKFRYKQNQARQTGVEFTLTMEDLEWPTHCPVLGLELNYFPEGHRQENSVSFDRFDSTKGYIPGNVYICSWRANRIKNNGTLEEHKKIYEFMLSTIGKQE